jgi:hypothetical protein
VSDHGSKIRDDGVSRLTAAISASAGSDSNIALVFDTGFKNTRRLGPRCGSVIEIDPWFHRDLLEESNGGTDEAMSGDLPYEEWSSA